jgi:hypothetical protein
LTYGSVSMLVALTKLVSSSILLLNFINEFISSVEFDFVFGPILMITYACLSNTLLLTGEIAFASDMFTISNYLRP